MFILWESWCMFKETLKDESWGQAMDEKLKAVEVDETWEIVKSANSKKLAGCMWIYKVKDKSDDTLRLVAKEYI